MSSNNSYWVKALTELRVLDRPFDGFWMKTGYRAPRNQFGPSQFDSQDTEQQSPITAIRVNSLFVDPAPGATLPAGRHHEVMGIAWDGGAGGRAYAARAGTLAGWCDATGCAHPEPGEVSP